jgi:putative tricarboxylic transport membrane protein
MFRRFGIIVSTLLILALAANVYGQGKSTDPSYPRKPINVLIGFAPGGGSDVMFSMVRPQLEKILKTTLVPIYKPGSGSDIALMELAAAKPDGYTTVISTTPMVPINAYVRQTGYKLSDIALAVNVVTDPGILVVRAESPYKTLKDYVQAAKKNPGGISVGVAAAPGDDWFATHMFEEITKTKFNIVPFSGDGPSWQAALAGHVDASSNNLGIVYPQVKAGTLRALAVMSDKRSPFLPDVPTFKELGYNLISSSMRGFAMPKKTPQDIIDKFAAAVKQVLDSPEFKENARKTAFPADYLGPKEYTDFIEKIGTIYKPLWDKYGKDAAGAK